MLHQLIDFAGLFTPVTIVASFIWGYSRGYKRGDQDGYATGYSHATFVKQPVRGPNGKFVKKGV